MNALAGVIAAAARLISGVQVQWVDSEPDPAQAVYFANHSSHLDFVVLWSSLPPEIRARTRPVAAKDYWSSGLRHALAVNVFRAVLVARHAAKNETQQEPADPRQAIEHMLEGMGDSESLILFPEGTRGTGEKVGPFRSGLYHLALHRPDVELVPAYLENLNRILPKGEFLPVPMLSLLTFGKPLQVERDEDRDAFLERAREAVSNLRRIGSA